MKITEEQIERANLVNLPQYLMSHGFELKRAGKEYVWKEHDSLHIKDNSSGERGQWFRFSENKGGDNIGFLREYMGMSFAEAVESLTGEQIDRTYTPQKLKQQSARELSLAEADNTRRVFAYLCKTRGLDYDLVASLVRQGMIAQEEKTGNVLFKYFDTDGKVIGTEKVGTSTNQKFKGIAVGSAGGYGFEVLRGSGEKAFFFESAIDLLSYLQFYGKEADNCRLVSMMGVKPQTVIDTMKRNKISPENVYLCTDNDKAGNEFAEKLMNEYPEMKRITTSDTYKDWNDMLRDIPKAEQKHEKKEAVKTDMQTYGNRMWNDATDNRDKSLVTISIADFPKFQKQLENSGINYYGYARDNSVIMAINDKDLEWFRRIADTPDLETRKSNRPYSPPEKNIFGSAEYRYIPQKEYFSAERDLVLKMAEIMSERGMQFSGRVYSSGKGTLTVSHADLYAVRNIRDEVIGMRNQFANPEKAQDIGNRDYRANSDTQYYMSKLTPEQFQEVRPFMETGVDYHAVSRDGKVAFAVDKDNAPAFHRALDNAVREVGMVHAMSELGLTMEQNIALSPTIHRLAAENMQLNLADFFDSRYDDAQFVEMLSLVEAYIAQPVAERYGEHSKLSDMLEAKSSFDRSIELSDFFSQHEFSDEQRSAVSAMFVGDVTRGQIDSIDETFTVEDIQAYDEILHNALQESDVADFLTAHKQTVIDRENADRVPTEEEVLFPQADLAKFLAERTLSSDEWEDMAYPLFERGYLDNHKPSDKAAFGYHLSEPALYDIAQRYHDGEDIRRELALGLLENGNSADIEFVFEDGKISDRTYYYAENLRHSLHSERTEDGFQCSFGGMERFVSFEEIGQAFIDRTHEEFDDLAFWWVRDDMLEAVPDISDEKIADLISAFDGAIMHGWENGDNQPKINRIKQALNDILGDEAQTEKAFAVIAKEKYHVSSEAEMHEKQPDNLSFHFGKDKGDEWVSESDIVSDFAIAYPDCSFALGNAVLEYLDEKQHSERSLPELKAGWYKKTDFSITAVIDGEEFNYDGRFDIGDGKGTGGGSLIDHIRTYNEGILGYTQHPFNQPEYKERAQRMLDIFVPFLEAHSELTAEEQRIFNDFKEQHPIRTYDDVEKPHGTFRIMQLSHDDELKYHGIRFFSKEFNDKQGVQLNHSDYTQVYEGDLSDYSEKNVLESIYARMNYGEKPEGYTGHSLSVSDVIVTSIDGKEKAYYCDDVGFTDFPEFFLEKEKVQEKSLSTVADLEVGDIIMYEGKRREVEEISEKSILLKDLDAPDFGGILLGTSDILAYDGWREDMERKGFEILSKAEKHEIEDKGPVSLRKVGDSYEMYYENAEIGAEILGLDMRSRNGMPLVEFSADAKDAYSKKLSDAGYSVLIEQAFELNPPKRETEKLQTLQDVVDKYFGTDCESAETEKGTWKLAIADGDKVGELFYGGEPVCAIYNRVDKMEIEPYSERTTFPKLLQTAMLEHNPDKPVEIMDFQRTFETPLDKAKWLINDFTVSEYEQEEDFADLHNIGLAFTTLTDDELPIQVTADLIDLKITYEFDGEVFKTEEYSDIEEMIENGLTGLDFDDLISVPDEVTERHTKKEEQTVDASTADIDKPLFSDAAVIDEIQKNENSDVPFMDAPILEGEQLTLFGDAVPYAVKTEKKKSEFAEGPFVDGVQVYEALAAEIDRGTGFVNGKLRVQEFYDKQHPTTQQLADFLKKEYGIGGHSGEGKISLVDYDSKGMTFSFENGEKFRHSWSNVSTMTKARLENNNYLSEEQRTAYEQMKDEKSEEKTADTHDTIEIGDRFRNRITGDVCEVVSLTGALPYITDDCTVTRQSGAFQITENISYNRLFNADVYEYLGRNDVQHEQPDTEHTAELPEPKNLSQLKKSIKEGMMFEITDHLRPECIGERRVVTGVTTVDFTSRKLDGNGEPTGKDLHMEFDRAKNWTFDGGELTSRLDNGDMLMSFHFIDSFEREKSVQSEKEPELAVETTAPELSVGDFLEYKGKEYKVESLDMDVFITLADKALEDAPRISSRVTFIADEFIKSGEYKVIEPKTEDTPNKSDNFTITDDALGEGGAKAKFRANTDAIRTLKTLEREKRPATAEEKETMSKYVGWGAIPQAFDKSETNWVAEYKELSELLTPAEYRQARSTVGDAFFTSPTIIEGIYEALGNFGFEGGNVLEPSMGVGNFFGCMPSEMQEKSNLYGVEIDSISGRIAQKLYPDADIAIQGFEKNSFQNDCFDAAVGNVPFGDLAFKDDKHGTSKLHDYFFAEALDKVKDGGILAFVTSSGTLDKKDESVRQMLADKADLIGAIRLPGGKNGAFHDNAGTDVTTDIIFLQKHDGKSVAEMSDIPDWVHIGETADGLPINQYFENHPDMVLGEVIKNTNPHGGETMVIAEDGFDLKTALHNAVSKLSAEISHERGRDVYAKTADGVQVQIPSNLRNYSFFMSDDQVFFKKNNAACEFRFDKGTAQHKRFTAFIELRDTTRDLIEAMELNKPDSVINHLQKKLNTAYDDFYKKYGLIHSQTNKRYFSEDVSYNLVAGLEKEYDKTELKQKSDIFTKRTIMPPKAVDHVDTALEALTLSIAEKAMVDFEYMSSLTDMTEDELKHELTGRIFKIPHTENTYQTDSEYLSGDIRVKLREAEEIAEYDPDFNINVSALKQAMPEPLKAGDIDVKIGATWIDPKYYDQFMYELFQTPNYQRSDSPAARWNKSSIIGVEYSALANSFHVSNKSSDRSVLATQKYGSHKMNAYDIFEHILNLQDPKVYMTVEVPDGMGDTKEKRVVDIDATRVVQRKADDIRKAFKAWIFKDPQRREAIVQRYNELFNSIRPREYDGSALSLRNYKNSNIFIHIKKSHCCQWTCREIYSKCECPSQLCVQRDVCLL